MRVENFRGKSTCLAVLVLGLLLVVIPASAIGVWEKGIVTEAPYLDQYLRIGINGVKYLIMPKTITYFPDGTFAVLEGNRQNQQLFRIKLGNSVRVKVAGFSIYEIVVGN